LRACWSPRARRRPRASTSNGVKIRYLDEGKGEPVVLIHGLFSSTLINWQLPRVVKELAKDHRVIALDLSGHGFSDRPLNKEAYGEHLDCIFKPQFKEDIGRWVRKNSK
jgi:pimeloyl-ACP methyl ester carboxylesterase